jgi:hypothetical protein
MVTHIAYLQRVPRDATGDTSQVFMSQQVDQNNVNGNVDVGLLGCVYLYVDTAVSDKRAVVTSGQQDYTLASSYGPTTQATPATTFLPQ